MFCQGITLNYWGEEYKDHKHLLILNQINTTGENAGNKRYNSDPVGIHIVISSIENI